MLFGVEMFGIELSGMPLVWVVVGCVIGLLVELFLFKGACALADVADPSWLFSFLIVLVFFVGRGLGAWFLYEQLKTSFDGIALYSLSFALSGLAFWVVCAVAYALVLSTTLKKSIFTASAQVILDALVGSLGVGITLFILAVLQIRQGPARSDLRQVPDAPVVAVRHVP
jgi:hypothetical protein